MDNFFNLPKYRIMLKTARNKIVSKLDFRSYGITATPPLHC